MKESTTNKIFVLLAVSLIITAFVYQCHPHQPGSHSIAEPKRKSLPVTFDDIREGALVKKIAGTGFYELLPQLEMNVEINIEGMVASTTVDQVFTNASEEPLEAVYVFPLPNNAAVHDMKMLVNDRLIQGVIRERAEARTMYEKAKAVGKRAGVTEQERPNIFTSSVANIMPGDSIIVRLQYVEKLSYTGGAFQLRFPMVVAPRYIPGNHITGHSGNGWAHDTDMVADASRITPPVMPPEMRSGTMISLRVNVNAGLPVASLQSVSHDIRAIQVDETAYRVELKKKKVIPNRDFVLEYRIEPGSEPKAALFTAQKGNDHYFMLMALPPHRSKKDASLRKEMVFVLDISGSMSGTSIVQAKAGLINSLNLLSAQDYFNIITFNNSYDVFAPYSVPASTVNIMNGINFVNRVEADGGTEALPALEHAMNMPCQPDALKMIVFLTDGSVGNEDQLITLVHQTVGRSRLFTVGIGSAPNSHVLEKVSRFGRGTFTYISDIEEVERKVNELFSRIENPVFMDLKLDVSDSAEIYPDPLPDLFAGQPLMVLGRTDRLVSTTAKLSGSVADGYFSLPLSLDLRSATKEPAIPTLWARTKIAHLMDGYRLGNEAVKQEIIDLAVHHRLLTKFTSFVAVEHRIVNPEGRMHLKTIPAELPEGWIYEKVKNDSSGTDGMVKLAYLPQTGSNAPLIGAVGLLLIAAGIVAACLRRGFPRTERP